MTSMQMADRLNMTPSAIRLRLKRIGVDTHKRHHDYDNEVFERISYEKYSIVTKKPVLQDKTDLDIIELYLKSKDNRISALAEKLSIGPSTVSLAIDKFFKSKAVIVESKMNYLPLDKLPEWDNKV